MKKKLFVLLPLCCLAAGCMLTYFIYHFPLSYQNDVILQNRIAKETAAHWGDLHSARYEDIPYAFSVVSAEGKLLYQSGETAAATLYDGLSLGYPILDVTSGEQYLGKVIITNSPDRYLAKYRGTFALFILGITLLITLCLCLCFYYINAKLLRPFQNLEDFASEVARGNLNFPLQRQKNNLFGAFTESFDIMREQLMLAREREFQANMNQKELVASLSHDIKTPVTSIRLTSELLLALEPDQRLSQKISMIHQKTDQIDELVTNLFQSTLADMEQLTVTVTEQYSWRLKEMIQNVDYKGKASLSDLPDCMLLLDELRLIQVLSNIFSNSYKYANTDIEVAAAVTETYLSLSVTDFGCGVPEADLPYLFNKFYRGSNAAAASGSGLGLYICKKLIEQMQGKIYCTCSKNRFTVVLMLKLV